MMDQMPDISILYTQVQGTDHVGIFEGTRLYWEGNPYAFDWGKFLRHLGIKVSETKIEITGPHFAGNEVQALLESQKRG